MQTVFLEAQAQTDGLALLKKVIKAISHMMTNTF